MTTMKFKSGPDGRPLLCHPESPLGPTPSGNHVTEITHIPDGTSTQEVIQLLDGTVNATSLESNDPDGGRWSLRFDELGIGRIVR